MRVVLGKINEVQRHDAACQLERGLDGISNALLGLLLDGDSVDDNVNVVLFLLVQGGDLADAVRLAVHLHPGVALRRQVPKHLGVLALAASDHRRKNLGARAFGHSQNLVDDLLRALLSDRLATHNAVRVADASKKKPEVVVDLGDRADRRTRVAAGRLLVDGDRRRKTLDQVHRGLIHLPQELPGVCGKRLDVTALTFGEDSVERQRRFTRARKPCENHQGIPRQVQGDVLQVMLAGATNH